MYVKRRFYKSFDEIIEDYKRLNQPVIETRNFSNQVTQIYLPLRRQDCIKFTKDQNPNQNDKRSISSH